MLEQDKVRQYKKDGSDLLDICLGKERENLDASERFKELIDLVAAVRGSRGYADASSSVLMYDAIDGLVCFEANLDSTAGESAKRTARKNETNPHVLEGRIREINGDTIDQWLSKLTYVDPTNRKPTEKDFPSGKNVVWIFLAYLDEINPEALEGIYKTLRAHRKATSGFRGQERFRTNSSFLSPRNHVDIPLVGRKREIDLLDEFIGHEDSFKVWAIVGPSGSGKTRLAFEWGNREELYGWDARLLHSGDNTDWANWQPNIPTLIVIDYIYGFDQVITDILKRFVFERQDRFHANVRLLILDHATPSTMSKLIKEPHLGDFEGIEGSSFDLIRSCFFMRTPMNLTMTPEQDGIIEGILCEMTKYAVSNPTIQNAIAYLRKMKGGWHPLFAMLVGETLKKNETANLKVDYRAFNRRQLIEYYLVGQTRATWKMRTLEGRWAACFIAAATATGGAEFSSLLKLVPHGDRKLIHDDWRKFVGLCGGIVKSSGHEEYDPDHYLPPFIPDILGESHFLLLLLDDQKNGHVLQDRLQLLILGGDKRTLEKRAINFLAFMTRLTSNLAIDGMEYGDTRKYWRLVEEFLVTMYGRSQSQFRWAIASVSFENYQKGHIVHSGDDKKYGEFVKLFLGCDLFYPPPNAVGLKHISLPMELCEHLSYPSDGKYQIPNDLLVLAGKSERVSGKQLSAIMVASLFGYSKVLSFLIQNGHKRYLNLVDPLGFTALSHASRSGRKSAVEILLKNGATVDTTSEDGSTPLILACSQGHFGVTRALLNHNANPNLAARGGFTALILAAGKGFGEVAKFLVSEGANIEATSESGRTAFICACIFGHLDVVKMLHGAGATVGSPRIDETKLVEMVKVAGHTEIEDFLYSVGVRA